MNYKSTLPEGAKELLTHYYCTGNAEHATKVRNMLYQNFEMEVVDNWIYDRFNEARDTFADPESAVITIGFRDGHVVTEREFELAIMRSIIIDMAMTGEDNPRAIAIYKYALSDYLLIDAITHCLVCDFDLVEELIDDIRPFMDIDPETVQGIEDPSVVDHLQELVDIYDFIDTAENEILNIDEADKKMIIDGINDEDVDGYGVLEELAEEKYNWMTLIHLFRQLAEQYVEAGDFETLENMCDRYLDDDNFEVSDASSELLQFILKSAMAHIDDPASRAYGVALSVLIIIESWCVSIDCLYEETENMEMLDILTIWKILIEKYHDEIIRVAKSLNDLDQAERFYRDAIDSINTTITSINDTMDDDDGDEDAEPKKWTR